MKAVMYGLAAAGALFLVTPILSLVPMSFVFCCAFARVQRVGTVTGIVLAHAVLASPSVVINVEAVMRTFDVRLEWAARMLGATAGQAFRRVTLPLIQPGVLAGALFAF